MKKYTLLYVLLLYINSFVFSQNTKENWEANYKKAVQLSNADSIDAALPYIQKAYEIAQNLFTPDSLQYQKSIIEYANYYALNKEYDKSLNTIKEVNAFQSILNEDIDRTNTNLEKLAVFFQEVKKNRTALRLYKDLIEQYKHEKIENSLKYANALKSISMLFNRIGKYEEAIDFGLKSNNKIKEIFGEDSIEFNKNLMNLVFVCIESEKYAEAAEYQNQVLLFYDNKDKNTPEYGAACFWMSFLSNHIDDYDNELTYLYKTIEVFGEDHTSAHTFYGNLGMAYQNLGNYENALVNLKKGIDLQKDKISKSHALKLQNLAFTYESLGEYEKAEFFYNKALKIWDNYLDKKDKYYGVLLNNIGKLHRSIEQYTKAKDYFNKALANYLQFYSKDKSRYGYLLNDYASMLLQLDNKEKAIQLLEENVQIAIDNNNMESEDFYGRQQSLAQAYIATENFIKAIPLLKSAIDNIPKIFGAEHPKFGNALRGLSDAYVGVGELNKAVPLITKSNTILIAQIDQIFQFRSEKEKKAYIKKLSKNFENTQSLALRNPLLRDQINELNLNNQLMLKGLLLENSKGVLSELTKLNDKKIDAKIVAYRKNKINLTKQLTLPILDRTLDIEALEEKVNVQEAELVKLYNTQFSERRTLVKDWRLIQKQLKEEELCIEFSHFREIEKGKPSDNVQYVAYIFEKNTENPKMIPLFEETALKNILSNKNYNNIYNSDILYNLIWQPISSFLSNKSVVYYSPSGLLSQIAFAAIKTPNKRLIDEYDLMQLSSTYKLKDNSSELRTKTSLFIGGIDYEYVTDNKEAKEMNEYNSFASSNLTRGNKSRGESWTYLKGTLDEVNNLKEQFQSNKSEVQVLTENNATEQAFKAFNGNSPNILHLATHGFFFENSTTTTDIDIGLSTEDRYRLAEDPLLRSGLLLAGANYAWRNGTNPFEEEDGILTAMEISNLDLSNTNLVVLSACETGLGDIDGSEGVYGLQRAFKMAGVDKLIMSLWEVPDAETAEFMGEFYRNWLNGLPIRVAFIKTQRNMNKQYENEPLKWAAFVLYE